MSGFGVRGRFPCVWWPYAREKDPKLPLVYIKLMKGSGKLMAERVKHWDLCTCAWKFRRVIMQLQTMKSPCPLIYLNLGQNYPYLEHTYLNLQVARLVSRTGLGALAEGHGPYCPRKEVVILNPKPW